MIRMGDAGTVADLHDRLDQNIAPRIHSVRIRKAVANVGLTFPPIERSGRFSRTRRGLVRIVLYDGRLRIDSFLRPGSLSAGNGDRHEYKCDCENEANHR